MRRNISQKIGEKVRKARKLVGITQEALSIKTHLHLSSVNRIENGKINPTFSTLNKIARVLGVNPRDLIP